MNSERLYRHSMPGILFLGCLLLTYLIKGGSIKHVEFIVIKENYLFFIAILITSPIIGIIISTIGHGLLHLIFNYSFYINNPIKNTSWIILRRDDSLKSIPEETKLTKPQLKEYFYRYQAFIREKLDGETLRFLERRWNFIWIHINNSTAIFFGLISGVFLDYSGQKNTIKFSVLILIVFFIVLYSFFAIRRIISLRKEVLNIEEESIKRKSLS